MSMNVIMLPAVVESSVDCVCLSSFEVKDEPKYGVLIIPVSYVHEEQQLWSFIFIKLISVSNHTCRKTSIISEQSFRDSTSTIRWSINHYYHFQKTLFQRSSSNIINNDHNIYFNSSHYHHIEIILSISEFS